MQPAEQQLIQIAQRAEAGGDPRAAAGAWLNVVRRFPANTDAFFRYSALAMDTDPEGVYQAATRVIAAHGEHPTLLVHAGLAALGAGLHAESVQHFERAAEVDPESIDARLGLAEARLIEGDREAAAAVVAPLIDAGRREAPVCILFARLAGDLGRIDEALDLLRGHAEEGSLPEPIRAELWFRIADLLDKRGEHEAAFDAAASGNALTPSGYDAAGYERKAEELVSVWNAERFGALAPPDPFEPTPIYVVGMPRSGSSLVESILASHPQIAGAGEVPVVDRVASELMRPGLGIAALGRRAFTTKLARMLAGGYGGFAGNAAHIVDKHLGNFLHLGIIAAVAPHARVIFMRRDPLDVGVSCYMNNFRGGVAFGQRLEDIGHFQKVYDRLVAHWRGVCPLQMLEVEYEQLVGEQRRVTEEMLAFVGVGFDEACMRFHESSHITRTLSTEQVRRAMHTGSLGRAARYGARLDPLRAALGQEPR